MTLIEFSLVLLPLMGAVLGLDYGGWGWLWGSQFGVAAGAALHITIWRGLGLAARVRPAPQPGPRPPHGPPYEPPSDA
jgi:hypothetical protein